MFSSIRSRTRHRSVVIPTTYHVLMPTESVRDGVLVRSSEFKCIDAAASVNQFCSSDFSIGNLMAIGAFNTMKHSIVVPTSRLNAADQFDNFNVSSDVSGS